MASLRRLPRSPNFIACFTGADGRRFQRSTGVKADGTVKARRRAQKIADEFEDVARQKKSAEQVQRVMRDLYEEVAGESLPSSSLRQFADQWLDGKKTEVSASTYSAYRSKLKSFMKTIGEKADRPISDITKADVQKWRDEEFKRVSASTVNLSVKMLRVFFGAARRAGVIADNPAEHVRRIKSNRINQRRPFTLEEIRCLLSCADDEWRSMILFGLYTGQRLGDIASLTWRQLDLDAQEIRIQTGKTGRHQKIPIPPPLKAHIEDLPCSAKPEFPIHPRAASIYEAQGRVGTLSGQFRDLMAKAGLITDSKHRRTEGEPGRSGKRRATEISFHSLRHTTTSLLKNAGVSPAIAEEFVGHDSAEMNRVYTHIELDAMRRAAATLPAIEVAE